MPNQDNRQRQQAVRRQRQLAELQAHHRSDWRYYLRQALSGRSVLRLLGFIGVIVALVFIGQTIVAHLRDQMHSEVATTNAQFIGAESPGLSEALSLNNLENTAIGFYLRLRQADLQRPADPSATALVPFTVSSGETTTLVADRLQQAGFITDEALFRLFMRYNGFDLSLEAGDFLLSPSMSIPEIASALQKARFIEVSITIPEGLRAEEIADLLSEQNIMDGAAFLAAVRTTDLKLIGLTKTYPFLANRPPGASLEGYLFPDTYRLPANAKPADLIGRMLDNFAAKVTPELIAQAQTQGLTLHQLLTIAAIVERETPRLDERPIVASVYLNRIKKGMLLNADPTVQYAMGYQSATGQWWKSPVLLEEYQTVQSPYNTYLYPGLPPGPICSPGITAIGAVVNPATTEYLYFVATGDGGHVFAVTAEQHAANVKAYENRK